MYRSLLCVLFAALPGLSLAQSFDWKGPETATLGQPYTVAVSCVEAASVVLLKDGVLVAAGPSRASVTLSSAEVATITFTAHAYGGSLEEGAATDQFTVEVLTEEQAATVLPRNDDDEGSAIVEVSSPVATEAP